jgi:hypothetical protein
MIFMPSTRRMTETCWSPAVHALEKNLTLLSDRCARLRSLKEGTLEWLTFFESIVVQLRAIVCENKDHVEKNFTVQGVLSRLGCADLREKFEGFLDSNIGNDRFGNQYDYRKAIKRLANKFICHYDNYDVTESLNAVPIEIYCDLINILKTGAIEVLVRKIVETVRQAIEQNLDEFKHDLICRLFGSQEEYERVSKVEWPRAD